MVLSVKSSLMSLLYSYIAVTLEVHWSCELYHGNMRRMIKCVAADPRPSKQFVLVRTEHLHQRGGAFRQDSSVRGRQLRAAQ